MTEHTRKRWAVTYYYGREYSVDRRHFDTEGEARVYADGLVRRGRKVSVVQFDESSPRSATPNDNTAKGTER